MDRFSRERELAQRLCYWIFQVVALLSLLVAAPVGAWANPLLLVDMRNGEVLHAEEAGRPWHPASLTKLTTALVAFNAIDNGRVSLTTPVTISARALAAPPSKVGFPVDTAITLQDALNLLIVKSANDIAIAIAETVSGSVEDFVVEMNQMARIMGMTATKFVNPHGLHDPAQVTSARDLAVLTLAIRRHFPQYAGIFATSVVRLGNANLRTHNNLLTRFRGTTGMKTGYVCSAGLNMVATVERDGRQLLAVVLGSSSGRERGELAAQMIVDVLAGRLGGTGQTVASIRNDAGAAPMDMRPFMCGAQARAYVAEREAAFPLGLEGQPSFLTDEVAARSYRVRTLGRVREVTMPRPRPVNAPLLRESVSLEFVATSQVREAIATPVPLPRPRP